MLELSYLTCLIHGTFVKRFEMFHYKSKIKIQGIISISFGEIKEQRIYIVYYNLKIIIIALS